MKMIMIMEMVMSMSINHEPNLVMKAPFTGRLEHLAANLADESFPGFVRVRGGEVSLQSFPTGELLVAHVASV